MALVTVCRSLPDWIQQYQSPSPNDSLAFWIYAHCSPSVKFTFKGCLYAVLHNGPAHQIISTDFIFFFYSVWALVEVFWKYLSSRYTGEEKLKSIDVFARKYCLVGLWLVCRIVFTKCVLYCNRSDTFPLLGNKSQPARVYSARNRDANVAEHNSSTGISLCLWMYISCFSDVTE